MAATCFRLSKGIISNVRVLPRKNVLSRGSLCSAKQFSTATDEKSATAQELTENEKKLAADLETLTKEIKGLKERCSELDDKYKRSLADSENLRRRLSKQIEDAKLFGIQGFCKDLLSVSDILQRATESVPVDELKSNSHLNNLYQGLTMTETELQKVFKRHGLAKVDPLGEKFDPNHHEALFEQPIPGKEPGIVVAVTKIGYKLHERIIRPAMVGVSK